MKVCEAIRGNFRSAGARVIRARLAIVSRFSPPRDKERERICWNRLARATCNFVAVQEDGHMIR